MEKGPLVLLYGSSLLMAGLESTLRAAGQLRVARIDRANGANEEQVRTLQPDAIIVDSLERYAHDWPNLAQLIGDIPNLVLMAMDASSAGFVVLFGERHPTGNLTDIVNVIQAHSSPR